MIIKNKTMKGKKITKKIHYLIILAIIVFGYNLNAQVLVKIDDGKGINQINASDYKNICINGIKRTDIEATYGNSNQMETLFNVKFNVTTDSEPDEVINFKDSIKGLFFSFVDNNDVNGNNELEYFNIFNNQSSFSVQGKTIKIDDNINLLGNVNINNDQGTITFNTASESSHIKIKFNKNTNKIISITYEVFT